METGSATIWLSLHLQEVWPQHQCRIVCLEPCLVRPPHRSTVPFLGRHCLLLNGARRTDVSAGSQRMRTSGIEEMKPRLSVMNPRPGLVLHRAFAAHAVHKLYETTIVNRCQDHAQSPD